jgi:hypothetical protein
MMGCSPFGLTVEATGLRRRGLRWKPFAKGSPTDCPWRPIACFEPHGY